MSEVEGEKERERVGGKKFENKTTSIDQEENHRFGFQRFDQIQNLNLNEIETRVINFLNLYFQVIVYVVLTLFYLTFKT